MRQPSVDFDLRSTPSRVVRFLRLGMRSGLPPRKGDVFVEHRDRFATLYSRRRLLTFLCLLWEEHSHFC